MLKIKREYFISFIPPSKANRVKINSKIFTKSGKRYIIPKDVSLKINKVIWELQLQNENEPIDKPVSVEIIFILPNRRRRDLDNIMKTLGDCLVYAGILKDDNLIYRQILEKKIIKGEEGVIIRIYPYDNKDIEPKLINKLKRYKEKTDGI
ncbi:RusA family crossover junction endodeoxyribonuclease [Persephonella sp.]